MINKTLLRLINSYFLRGFFGPFFGFVFPILILFIMANAFYDQNNPNNIEFMRSIVGGILITTLLGIGFFTLPATIIEFKKSTLMKRIGAAQISKTSFINTILFYYILWSLFALVYVPFWGGLWIAYKPGMNWSVAYSPHYLLALPFMLLSMVLTIAFGIMIVSRVNTVQAAMGIINALWFPISLLSGSFIPKDNVDNSSVLNVITYILPTKYCVDPFFASWKFGISGLDVMGWEAYAYPFIAIVFTALFLGIAIKSFKWTS